MQVRVSLLAAMAFLGVIVLPFAAFSQAILQEQKEMEKHVPREIKAPSGASVKITEPADGATVSSPVKVVMMVEGIKVVPAGIPADGTGHHHLIINGAAPAIGEVTPKDATHLHYGKGQTEAMLELAPGTHKITAQFADGMHRSFGPQMVHTITIEVK